MNIRSVIELGCGDGHQLGLVAYPRYVGLDVSATAIRQCMARYGQEPTKSFIAYDPMAFHDPAGALRADAALSLDVLFHLVEQDVFDRYMVHLFGAAERLVVIYAPDRDREQRFHERERSFTRHIAAYYPEWTSIRHIPNPYPFDAADPRNTSDASFHVFERQR
ncbi:MAG: class I SAM-dependent methyltransferase [Flavobacteriales bacterium]